MPRFLVTAGNTRERIDRVRDWGNIFTGTTGYSIALTLASLGEVDLLTSNTSHLAEAHAGAGDGRIHGTHFTSHANLRDALAKRMAAEQYDGVFMTAAVADYLPAGGFTVTAREKQPDGSEVWRVRDVTGGKIKGSFDHIAFLGTRSQKIVDLFRTEWAFKGLLVKFKLEVGLSREELVAVGRASRVASGANFLVANTLEMVDGPEAGAFLIGETVEQWVPRAELAKRLAAVAVQAIGRSVAANLSTLPPQDGSAK